MGRERSVCLYLNSRNEPLAFEISGTGGLTRGSVHVAPMIRTALLCGAAAIILAHNHPSGDPSPSSADLDVTRHVARAAKLLDITLLDHVVVGSGSYRSLADDGDIARIQSELRMESGELLGPSRAAA